MSKVMLVEDDDSLREIYSIRLTAEGYAIVTASDGEEALAVAVKERPDLIISDVMMPKISGFDMLDILRSTPETQNIKVIMMTALSSEDERARGENLGANRYLVKSQVGIEDVVNAVHEVLGDQSVTGVINTTTPGNDAAAPGQQPAVALPNETAVRSTSMDVVATEVAAAVANPMVSGVALGVPTEETVVAIQTNPSVVDGVNVPSPIGADIPVSVSAGIASQINTPNLVVRDVTMQNVANPTGEQSVPEVGSTPAPVQPAPVNTGMAQEDTLVATGASVTTGSNASSAISNGNVAVTSEATSVAGDPSIAPTV